MRAVQIVELTGPETALRVAETPEPTALSELVSSSGVPVTIDVRAAGVSFPELLQSKGKYQYQPELPFVPGSEVAGIVRDAPPGADVKKGDRVFAYCQSGGFAERVLAPAALTFPLPDALTFAQGAALFSNYHTAYFSLVTRGRAQAGESVVVHGAAGGVGTAALQVANGLGLTTIAVVSNGSKAEVARQAGAQHVVLSGAPWKDQVLEITDGGADIVFDTVGDRALDSLRALRELGRMLIVGFASGEIPQIKVNRLLLRNIEVIGAGHGAYTFPKPQANKDIAAQLALLISSGHVRPIIGSQYPLNQAAQALVDLDTRKATGKVVLTVDDAA